MGTSRSGKEEERVLWQSGSGSYVVTLPIALIRQLKWKKGQKVVIKKSGSKLAIEDWKKKA